MENARVLFVHSLESGPGGSRQKVLEKAIGRKNVCTPNLQTRNFFIAFAILYVFVVLGTIAGCITFFLLSQMALGFVFAALSVIILLMGYLWLGRYLVFYLIQRSIGVIENVCLEYKPNIIVASSLGSVIALNLKPKNIPLILLSPSQDRYYKRMNMRVLPNISGYTYTLIIHGKEDRLVPLEDSLRLMNSVEEKRRRLIIVDDENRLSHVSVESYRNWVKEALKKHERLL